MRKELLLQKKRRMAESLTWYLKNTISDEVLEQFSLHQICLLCETHQRAEDYREKCSPFYTLSACEVLQKETDKIAYFENSGTIREETEEEVLNGAASAIYKSYTKKKKQS